MARAVRQDEWIVTEINARAVGYQLLACSRLPYALRKQRQRMKDGRFSGVIVADKNGQGGKLDVGLRKRLEAG